MYSDVDWHGRVFGREWLNPECYPAGVGWGLLWRLLPRSAPFRGGFVVRGAYADYA